MIDRVIVTGGAGFIGSALIRYLLDNTSAQVCNVDKLTYAGNLSNLDGYLSKAHKDRYHFIKGDISNKTLMRDVVKKFKPTTIMNLAAESHVDRSIDSPENFIETNIFGTFNLLTVALDYWEALTDIDRTKFRFHHISTDEVYGSLGESGYFTENTSYDPRSPYSASKAASDHLVKSWHHTYGLPIIVTNCSNNYGPYHFPEKLIPLVIINALNELELPIYGKGDNVRDWLYVEDHAEALVVAVSNGVCGQTYNIGGNNERTNLQVVELVCTILDETSPRDNGDSYLELIRFVEDRLGHDFRYAIDASKIKNELGWHPKESFESGLKKTIDWYVKNEGWWRPLFKSKYLGGRLGRKNK